MAELPIDGSQKRAAKKSRAVWPVGDSGQTISGFGAAEEAIRPERVARWRFIAAEFGPSRETMLVGGLGAMFAIEELKSSFVYGNFVATVLLCQTFVECSLAGHFSMEGADEQVQRGMMHLIDESVKKHQVSRALASRLHELRRMRNPYIHPRSLQTGKSLLHRVVESKKNPWAMAESDARLAIQIAVDFLREGCAAFPPPDRRRIDRCQT